MADNTELGTASGGDTIATDDVTDGGVANSAKVQRVKAGFGADNNYKDVENALGLPVEAAMSAPVVSSDTSSSLSAGGSTDLDSAQISSGLTGKLAAFLLTASVPLKGELKTVLNGSETSRLVVFTRAGETRPIELPNKKFITVAQDVTAGLDGFRFTVTNLDNENAADVYATFFYDQE